MYIFVIWEFDTEKHNHGCHRSGNGQGKKFFNVREMSGNFILGQGKFSQGKWVQRAAVNRRLETAMISEILHLFGQGTLTFIREKSGNFKN